MKRIAILLMLSLVLFCFAQNLQLASAALDNTLVVYVGAHPDDIDIGMSGSLFKHDVGKHPILWIVATDGGADIDEYNYEVGQGWVSQDGYNNSYWFLPYLYIQYITRDFYSWSLSSKRCGGYLDSLSGSWVNQPAYHSSSFGNAYDWRTRVTYNVSSSGIEKAQMRYIFYTPYRPLYALYPDGSLAKAESAFTNSLAIEIAMKINAVVVANNYTKDLLYIDAHAPEEVASNANEHPDHKITGNAVRLAINYLHNYYGFGTIGATWFTIYNDIAPKPPYVQGTENISGYMTQKSNLCKACWETEFIMNLTGVNYSGWIQFPTEPVDHEHYVGVDYYA